MSRPTCLPCEKQNHRFCLQQAVDVATSNVVACGCNTCSDECESCGYEADQAACPHGKLLCSDCANECRPCEDAAAEDEATERTIAELRGS